MQKPKGEIAAREAMLSLGTWLGRRQAFGLIANRCSAADAECLKNMRDSGEYKKLGLSWEQFCKERAGISRAHADRLIGHLEEFGANYFRLTELMPISSGTYRLIAGAVSESGLEVDGKNIPLSPENRKKVADAVETLRQRAVPRRNADALTRRLQEILCEFDRLEPTLKEQLYLVGVLDKGAQSLALLAERMRRKLQVV